MQNAVENGVEVSKEVSKATAAAAPAASSSSKWLVWLILLAVGGAVGYRFLQEARGKPAATPGPPGGGRSGPRANPVVTPARRGDIPVYLSGLGAVSAFNSVTIRSRVDGQLVKVAFQEGQFVKEGDLLAEIDPRPFQVQLEQAEGQMARDLATLNDAKAILARSRTLFEEQVIAKAQVETQTATVAQIEGSIKADQATINNARLMLTFCRIVAPISGRIGLRIVDQGNMVRANDPNGLVVIAQLQPISVLFTIPEDNLPSVLKRMNAGASLEVDAYDRDGKVKLAAGTLQTVDNQIDSTTGTSRLKAVFPNQDGALFPNQFVNARWLLERKRGSTIVPAAAVQRGPQGAFIYVIKDSTVEVRPVKVGISEGNDVSIEEGIEPDEQVVIDGADRLQEGMKVDLRKPGQGKGGEGKGEGKGGGHRPKS